MKNTEPLVVEGKERTWTVEENQIFDQINKLFFFGSKDELQNIDFENLAIFLNSSFIWDYYWDFLNYLNKSRVSHPLEKDSISTPELLMAKHIINKDVEFYKQESVMGSYIAQLSGQWRIYQQVPDIRWFGSTNQSASHSQAKVDPIMATSQGICSWLAPLSSVDDQDLWTWPKGVVPGENNGLQLLIDTETYDYVREENGGLGVKIAVTHPLDFPIIEQVGVSVAPGTASQLGVSVSISDIAPSALRRYTEPAQRKCYLDTDIELSYLPYEDEFHYSMSNCLFEAVMQRARTECGCLPGPFSTSGLRLSGAMIEKFNSWLCK